MPSWPTVSLMSLAADSSAIYVWPGVLLPHIGAVCLLYPAGSLVIRCVVPDHGSAAGGVILHDLGKS